MYLVKLTVETKGYSNVDSVFLATEREVKYYEGLHGTNIAFGEIEGKHSFVEGVFDKNKMEVNYLPKNAYDIMHENLGKYISGVCITDYLYQDEMFEFLYHYILMSFHDIISKDLKNLMFDSYLSKYDDTPEDYKYVKFIMESLFINESRLWEQHLEENSGVPASNQKEKFLDWMYKSVREHCEDVKVVG